MDLVSQLNHQTSRIAAAQDNDDDFERRQGKNGNIISIMVNYD